MGGVGHGTGEHPGARGLGTSPGWAECHPRGGHPGWGEAAGNSSCSQSCVKNIFWLNNPLRQRGGPCPVPVAQQQLGLEISVLLPST